MEAIRDWQPAALQVEERQRAARRTLIVRAGTRLDTTAGRPAPSALVGVVDRCYHCAN